MKGTPLCVDLDGTLVFTDTLLEAFLKLLKRQPTVVFQGLVWLLKGKAYFKRQVSDRASLEPALLPYNQELLAWLKQEKNNGRRLCLATGSDKQIAQAIANHLGIFDLVIGSDGRHNTAGPGKAERLIAEFGKNGFDYVGNSPADLPVWAVAQGAIVANASASLTAHAKKISKVIKILPRYQEQHFLKIFLRAIRVHQWVKNLLLFVPLFAGHKVTDINILAKTGLAFIAFSFIASAVYLLNDLLDLEADRAHPLKNRRPLARGIFSLDLAAISFVVLLALGLGLSLWLPANFLYIVLLYLLINLVYSFRLKKILWLDVVVLAGFYVLRIMAGSAAAAIDVSGWLFAFAALFFLSLALAKRGSELTGLPTALKQRAAGRAYTNHDAGAVTLLGLSSGYGSIAVLGLYVFSAASLPLYSQPQVLWWLLPLCFTWISRVWYLTRGGQLHEDPILFAAGDGWSYLTAVALVVIVWLAA